MVQPTTLELDCITFNYSRLSTRVVDPNADLFDVDILPFPVQFRSSLSHGETKGLLQSLGRGLCAASSLLYDFSVPIRK